MADAIRYEQEGGVATLTIDRPEKRNAMSFAVLEEFLGAVRRAGEDEAVRALIVTGAGGAFCAGTDLGDRPKSGTGRPDADASAPAALRSLSRSESYGSVARLAGAAPRRPCSAAHLGSDS